MSGRGRRGFGADFGGDGFEVVASAFGDGIHNVGVGEGDLQTLEELQRGVGLGGLFGGEGVVEVVIEIEVQFCVWIFGRERGVSGEEGAKQRGCGGGRRGGRECDGNVGGVWGSECPFGVRGFCVVGPGVSLCRWRGGAPPPAMSVQALGLKMRLAIGLGSAVVVQDVSLVGRPRGGVVCCACSAGLGGAQEGGGGEALLDGVGAGGGQTGEGVDGFDLGEGEGDGGGLIGEAAHGGGCGWLFVCIECRKAFTFAKCVIVNESLESIVRRQLCGRWQREPSPEDVAREMEFMEIWLKHTAVGREYVYFDGCAIDAAYETLKFDGWHARHDLPFVPQVRALTAAGVRTTILGNKAYWVERHIEEDE